MTHSIIKILLWVTFILTLLNNIKKQSKNKGTLKTIVECLYGAWCWLVSVCLSVWCDGWLRCSTAGWHLLCWYTVQLLMMRPACLPASRCASMTYVFGLLLLLLPVIAAECVFWLSEGINRWLRLSRWRCALHICYFCKGQLLNRAILPRTIHSEM